MTTIKVYDVKGDERTLEWALSKYNPKLVIATKTRPRWELVELREVIGPSSLTVRLVGERTRGIPVAWWWEDAWKEEHAIACLPEELKPNAKLIQRTSSSGDTGFGMGGGAYYHPDQGQSGPHAIWISEYEVNIISDLVDGLGMIAGTNHAHLEPKFCFMPGEESSDECEELVIVLEQIKELVDGVLVEV